MSYRVRRARSRTPPARIRVEAASSMRGSARPLQLKGRPVSSPFRSHPDGKRSRERDDPKRNRWEAERNRNRVRSRSRSGPRSRTNPRKGTSVEKRGDTRTTRFEPPAPPFIGPQHSPGRKYLGFQSTEVDQSWHEPGTNVTKFSPPSRFSPAGFPSDYGGNTESTFNANVNDNMWRQNDMHVPDSMVSDPFGMSINAGTSFKETQDLSANAVSTGPLPLMGQPVGNSLQDFVASSGESKSEEQTPTMPEFNPETSKLTSDEWIKLIETTAIERDWKSDEKLYVLSSRLAGCARQWYLNTGMKCKNWSELKTAFFIAFPSENDFYFVLKKMFERVKLERETMTTYFHHKVALLNACDIYGRKAVSCIVGGLPNGKLKEDSKFQNFDDPDLLYQYLRSYTEQKRDTPKKAKLEEKKMKPSEKKAAESSQLCYFCKKSGHVAANCENKFHLLEREAQRYAELAAKGLVTSNNVMHGSLSQAPTFNKYFTDVAINGIPIRGYVDQASKCSTIREENAQFLKLPIRKQNMSIFGFGGNSVSAYGYVEVPICIDRAIANVKLYIVPNYVQVIPIVVGQNFTEQPHVVVMKDGDKIRFYQRMDNGQTNFDF